MQKAMALSTHSRRIEDPCYATLHRKKLVVYTSERHYSRRKIKLNRTCPFERLEWLFISKIHSYHELERIK